MSIHISSCSDSWEEEIHMVLTYSMERRDLLRILKVHHWSSMVTIISITSLGDNREYEV